MPALNPLLVSYKNDDDWFAQVAPQLKADFDDTRLTFDNEIGKGDFYRVDVEPGLRVRKIEVVFHQPVLFMRKSTTHPGYYVLVANLSEQYLEARTQQQQFKLGYGSDNGLYFSSPYLSASYAFQPGVPYHLIFIILTYDRVRDFIDRQPPAQQQLLQTIVAKDKPVYHVECLDVHLMSLLKEMDKDLHEERPNNLLLHSKTLELCYHILQRVEQRRSNKSTRNIHEDDVVKLNEIRRLLLNQYEQACPPIEEAARTAAMSPTKFKNLFKQMYGHTYYQFYKNVRMHKARELLEQQKMNVSEVGYMLGYNNLSKFTKAFKDVFAVTPGSMAGV
jgi:AraC-like DNA-binding protein